METAETLRARGIRKQEDVDHILGLQKDGAKKHIIDHEIQDILERPAREERAEKEAERLRRLASLPENVQVISWVWGPYLGHPGHRVILRITAPDGTPWAVRLVREDGAWAPAGITKWEAAKVGCPLVTTQSMIPPWLRDWLGPQGATRALGWRAP